MLVFSNADEQMNHPGFLIQRVWGWSLWFYISTGSQVMLMTSIWVPQVLCLTPSYWGSFSKEQLKLKNLATSSHNKTSIWCRASFSNHRTLGRIHGVSGREHVMEKKKKFLDPSGLSSPKLEIKMIMSLTCKVPIFYIIVIFNNNYLVIIQITPFLWEIQWALLTLIV